MHTNLRSKLLSTFLVAGLATAPLAGCSSTPGSHARRNVSSEEKPLNQAQIANVGDLGIGILRLSVLANSLERGKRIDAALAERLAGIEQGRRNSVQGVGIASMVLGLGAVMAMYSAQSLDELMNIASSGLSLLMGGNAPAPTFATPSARSTISVGGGVAVVGAGILIAGSAGSQSFANSSESETARAAAETKRLALQAEVDRNVDQLVRIYAQVFSLTPSATLNLKQSVHAEILRKARGGEETVTVDVPRMMIDSRLITDAAFNAFRTNLAALELLERSPQDLRQILAQENYAANVAQCKEIVRAYANWLRAVQPGLTGRDATNVSRAIAQADRLVARI